MGAAVPSGSIGIEIITPRAARGDSRSHIGNHGRHYNMSIETLSITRLFTTISPDVWTEFTTNHRNTKVHRFEASNQNLRYCMTAGIMKYYKYGYGNSGGTGKT